MAITLQDPTHWRRRAHELRSLATGVADTKPKEVMLQIAEGYELLAIRAAERQGAAHDWKK
jgi:hypothetical protein